MTASAGVSGWVEFLLLRRTLNKRLGHTGLPASLTMRLWAAAALGAAVALGVKLVSPIDHPIVAAVMVLTPYGVIYLGLTVVFQVPEAKRTIDRFL